MAKPTGKVTTKPGSAQETAASRLRRGQKRQAEAAQTGAARIRSAQQRQAAVKKAALKRRAKPSS